MLCERTKGPVNPFHDDDKGHIFRFFSGDSISPAEQNMHRQTTAAAKAAKARWEGR